jgi:hypothetical protein
VCECPKAVPEDPQYEENLPHLHCTPGSAFTEPSRLPRRRAHLSVGVRGPDDDEPEPVVQDERTARMALSMIVEPDDAVTGRLSLGELGALEVLRLAERDDGPVPGLGDR